MNSVDEIVSYKIKLGHIKDMNSEALYQVYKHPTLYTKSLSSFNRGEYNLGVGYKGQGYYINSIPVVHIPSAIELTEDKSVCSGTYYRSPKRVILEFPDITVNLYDVAYASSTSQIKKLNASDVPNISGLLEDLNNAKFAIELSCEVTNTHLGNLTDKRKTIYYDGFYHFVRSADNPLVLIGYSNYPTVTITLSDFGTYTYYGRLYCQIQMKGIKNKIIFGTTTFFIDDTTYRPIGYSKIITLDYNNIPAEPSPSAKGAAMEIGEYDE
jgi:hypothetical protein